MFSDILRETSLGALARKALKRPRAAAVALVRILGRDWRTLAFGRRGAWLSARREVAESGLLDGFQLELNAAFSGLGGQTVRGKPVVAGVMRRLHAEMLWALVRLRRPEIVVETGVCNGLSSAVILEAMERNGQGRLISVDLPEFSGSSLGDTEVWDGKGGAVVPAGRSVGWLVPEGPRQRWRLELGKAQDLLLPLLAEAGPIDIFIHDSEHSYANQMFEFEAGYRALRSGGLLVATDINWSPAFEEFRRKLSGTSARIAYVDPSCAIVSKP